MISVHVGFVPEVGGRRQPNFLEFGATFYEADIKVDAILSYPWMVQEKMGVFPHKSALAVEMPNLTLLFGLNAHDEKKESRLLCIVLKVKKFRKFRPKM